MLLTLNTEIHCCKASASLFLSFMAQECPEQRNGLWALYEVIAHESAAPHRNIQISASPPPRSANFF